MHVYVLPKSVLHIYDMTEYLGFWPLWRSK